MWMLDFCSVCPSLGDQVKPIRSKCVPTPSPPAPRGGLGCFFPHLRDETQLGPKREHVGLIWDVLGLLLGGEDQSKRPIGHAFLHHLAV